MVTMEPNVPKGRFSQRSAAAAAAAGSTPSGQKRKRNPISDAAAPPVVAKKSAAAPLPQPSLAEEEDENTPRKVSKKDGTYSRVMQVGRCIAFGQILFDFTCNSKTVQQNFLSIIV